MVLRGPCLLVFVWLLFLIFSCSTQPAPSCMCYVLLFAV
jgi:hypothetical protein